MATEVFKRKNSNEERVTLNPRKNRIEYDYYLINMGNFTQNTCSKL